MISNRQAKQTDEIGTPDFWPWHNFTAELPKKKLHSEKTKTTTKKLFCFVVCFLF